MGHLSDCKRGQIVGARLVEASVTKTATLLGVSRATVSKVTSAYTNHDKTTSAMRSSERKSTLTERDRRTLRRTVSKNHTTTVAEVTAELNILLEDPVSTKIVRRELQKSNIHGRAAIAKPLIAESNTQMRKPYCHDCNTWTSDNWTRARDVVR
jgi:predicted transcriptional regulator